MKKQILVIHGGDTFNTYEEYLAYLKNYQIDFERYRTHKKDWKANLDIALGDDFKIIFPDMPNKRNAKYLEWKIWFEKFIPYLEAEATLVGSSLGGTFLTKYLSENKFPKKIKALFLVAAPFDAEGTKDSMGDFIVPQDLNKVSEQTQDIFLYYSKDDVIAPFHNFTKYQSKFKNATARIFKNKGHFRQTEFPELVNEIKKLYNL